LNMGLRKEIAHVETKLDQVGSALNDAQKYLRRHNFRIFNALVTEIANKEVFGWTFKYFTHKLGVNIDEKAIDRAHRTGKERGGKVKISIRFCSWHPRFLVFRNRKNGSYPIRVEFTKTTLFSNDIRNLEQQNPTTAKYPFVQINCKIGVNFQDNEILFPRFTAGLKNKIES